MELQSKCIQEELQALGLHAHKLRGMLEDRRKKLELEKIMCKNATWHEANNMF
jgi:hypothetical protein